MNGRLASALTVGALVLTACGGSGDRERDGFGTGGSGPGTGGSGPGTGGGGPLLDTDAGSQAQKCAPGLYEGVFDGEILIIGLIPTPINGSVSLTLMQSATGMMSGEFRELEISNGNVNGTDTMGNPYAAQVVGKLNCDTLQVEGGFLENGTYTTGGITYGFRGPVTAGYNPQAHAFYNGTWNVMEATGLATASGTWGAQLAQ